MTASTEQALSDSSTQDKELPCSVNFPKFVRKRNGSQAEFNGALIYRAIEKAFRAERNIPNGNALDTFSAREVEEISRKVIETLINEPKSDQLLDIEKIQDLVEVRLMQYGHYSIAKRYIVYREEQAKARELRQPEEEESLASRTSK